MNGRPTPAQARLLRALAEYEYVRILWNGSGAKLVGPDSWKMTEHLEREGIHLRSPTVRVLVHNEWLHRELEEDGLVYSLSPAGHAVLEELDDDDFRSPVPDMTASDIHSALKKHFYGPKGQDYSDTWAYFLEVALDDWQAERRIDALAFRLYAPHELHAIEVKVARGDFLRELDDKTKRLPAQQLAHCFYFAAPAGLIEAHELPEGCGLLEVHGSRSVVETAEPEYTRAERPTWGLFGMLLKAAVND